MNKKSNHCLNLISDRGVEMKVTVFLISILISFNVLSEEYVCSVSYSKSDVLEVKTYQRNGSVFIKNDQFGESIFQITYETEEFIILNQTYEYPWIFITFLDKENKNIVEEFTMFDKTDSFSRITGKCLIKN